MKEKRLEHFSMYHIDYNSPVHVHFIGIGGISMSGLAVILHSKGFTVSGSDERHSALTDSLSARGITVNIGQSADNITEDIDVVVYTAAIHPDNPEYAAAHGMGIPLLSRAELLGEIMSNYRTAIGVSGTHGKTTTTSMIAELLMAAELDPTVTVGGILPSIGGNLRIGESDNFLTEACEYTNSFLSFCPNIGVILNVEEDHLDFFKDINDIRSSFRRYAELLPEGGLLVINGNIDNLPYFTEGLKCSVVTVGNESCDYFATDIQFAPDGCASYTLNHHGQSYRVELGVVGIHNVYNSLAAVAVAEHLGIPSEIIVRTLAAFKGSERRFQLKGVVNGFTIIDDYAHHPAEIAATLTAARNYPHKRIVCVFQPHTYTRTKAFLNDFAKVLSTADMVVLADIYAAREKNTIGISSADLQKLIAAAGTRCIYEPDFTRIQQIILNECKEGDLVLTMGAGNIVDVGDALVAGR